MQFPEFQRSISGGSPEDGDKVAGVLKAHLVGNVLRHSRATRLDISRSVAFLAASASSVQLKSVVSVMTTRSSTLMLLVIRLPILVIAFPPVMWMRSRIGS